MENGHPFLPLQVLFTDPPSVTFPFVLTGLGAVPYPVSSYR